MGKKDVNTSANSDYDFSVADEDDMVFWSKGSVQRYLSSPTKVMKSAGIAKSGGGGIITTPKNLSKDIFARYGIIAIAYTKRMRKFYHYVNLANYTDLQFVLSGSLSFKIDKKVYKAKAGETLILPKGTIGTLRILANNTKIFWINVNSKSEIFKYAGKDISVKKFVSFSEMTNVLALYQAEVYKFNNPLILENYASAFYALLIRNLTDESFPRPKVEALKALICKIKTNLSTSITTASAAKKLRITIYELNKLSREVFGENFSKVILEIKMREALRLLRSNQFSCAEVAQKTGYKSQFSFSRLFKDYHKISPSRVGKVSKI